MPPKTFELNSGSYQAFLFDMDGVLTDTASTHSQAWKTTFDAFLQDEAQRQGGVFVPFDAQADYHAHVDGKARAQGVRDFLASRSIELPEGQPDDSPDAPTVNGLGNRKNDLVLKLIAERGADVYPTSIELARLAKDAGIKVAVVSASANAPAILTKAGVIDLFDARIDGVIARQRGLAGKPAPETYLAAAELLGVRPERAVVFEDAQAGVAAGRAGNFGLVVGIDRVGQRNALLESGADIVVEDLGELIP